MMNIHLNLNYPKRDTKNRAILKLLNAIYTMLERFYYDFDSLYEFEKIEIEDDEKNGRITFILLGNDKKSLEYLEITITSWYDKEKQEN
ncbi:MAG: hypothetical protein DRP29_04120 [Thermodesulfobacteriota bacterium]|nr:MAG: hypothetical protein DRP29_04120 [Thermodesulfobacteriota bacterium]